MESLLPLLLIFAVMMLPLLFMSNRQKKAQQKQRELVDQLGIGDEVRTHSGFYGLIVETFDDVVILESEDGSQSKWARQAIAMAADPTGGAEGGTDAEQLSEDPADADRTDSVDAGPGTVPGVTVDEATDRSEDRRDR